MSLAPDTLMGQTLPPITPAGLPTRKTEAVQSMLPYLLAHLSIHLAENLCGCFESDYEQSK
jgi:hypothetical protein